MRALGRDLCSLARSVANWTANELLLYRPMLTELLRLVHVSLSSIRKVRAGNAVVHFETPDPNALADRILAGAIASLRQGDDYASTTSADFWRSILSTPARPTRSGFFAATVRALNLGVSIRRLLPIAPHEVDLRRALDEFTATGDVTVFPARYAFLVPHVELLLRYENYEFRVLDLVTAAIDEPEHCGLARWTDRRLEVAFVPTYRSADGIRRLTGAEVVRHPRRLREQFDRAWGVATPLRLRRAPGSSAASDDPLLARLIELTAHPNALAREGCRSVAELAEIVELANDSDPGRLATAPKQKQVFEHLGECSLCRRDFGNLRAAAPPRGPGATAPARGRQTEAEVAQLSEEVFALSDSFAEWSTNDVLLFRPLIQQIALLGRYSMQSVTRVRSGNRNARFETPNPKGIIDDVLGRHIDSLERGDSYSSTTLPRFWQSIVRDPKHPHGSAFFRSMIRALDKGVRIRRLLPLSVKDWRLFAYVEAAMNTGEFEELPAGHEFLAPHLAAAAEHRSYEFRLLATGTRSQPDEPRHCGIAHWAERDLTVTLEACYRGRSPASKQLTGVKIVVAEAERLEAEFEDAWQKAFDVRELETREWLDSIPLTRLIADLPTLPTTLLRRLLPAIEEKWVGQDMEGMPPFHDQLIATG